MRLGLRHSIAAATLAALWIAVPALSALHFALEDHVYCAEHGALEEQGEASHLVPAAERAGDVLHDTGAERTGEAHESCALAQLHVRDEVVLVPPTIAPHVPPQVRVGFSASKSILPARSALSFAPKNSPPLAA